MNPILTMDGVGNSKPTRYYARVDSVETIGLEGTERIVQLDGVAADDFDRIYNGQSLFERLDGLPLALMELSTEQHGFSRSLESVVQPGRWVQVRALDTATSQSLVPGPSVDVDYYWNLFGTATTQLSEIRAVAADLAKKLDHAFSLDDVPDADTATLNMLLLNAVVADFVVVLDVGQGNANALWRDGGGAVLYFDFGGGVKANSKTFPAKGFHACFTQSPPIVLSHWDYDHWSSACRATEAMNSAWIAPRTSQLGVTHLAFAFELHRRGNLHIWPDTLGALNQGSCYVEKCTGSDRNDSGLTLFFRDRNRTVLMTGDAAYDCIPSLAAQPQTSVDAIVASHHGSKVRSIERVIPAVQNAPLIYSVGHGNYYGHPALHACLAYLQQGWLPSFTASTAQHVTRRPNNIGISLRHQPPSTGCGQCTLRILQMP